MVSASLPRCDALQLRVGEQWLDVRAGCATLIPPGAPIEFHFAPPAKHTHLFVHFKMAPGETQPFWALQHLGARFETHYDALSEVIGLGARSSHGANARAAARVWDVLWQLTPPRQRAQTPHEQLVGRAKQIIEKRAGEPVSIADLARELEVSHSHLTRCFRAVTGQTPVEWTRARRIERACYLLEHDGAAQKYCRANRTGRYSLAQQSDSTRDWK